MDTVTEGRTLAAVAALPLVRLTTFRPEHLDGLMESGVQAALITATELEARWTSGAAIVLDATAGLHAEALIAAGRISPGARLAVIADPEDAEAAGIADRLGAVLIAGPDAGANLAAALAEVTA